MHFEARATASNKQQQAQQGELGGARIRVGKGTYGQVVSTQRCIKYQTAIIVDWETLLCFFRCCFVTSTLG